MRHSRNIFATFVLVLGLVASAPAQLSGNYTIDSTQATSATNYSNFIGAVSDLLAQGVSAPVTFTVATGSGPYAGFTLAGAINGSSATNTITFTAAAGASPRISGVSLFGLSNVVSIGMSTTANSGPTDLVFEGIEFDGAPGGAGLMIAGASRITVRNCLVRDCGVGIYLAGSVNCDIDSNEVRNVGSAVAIPGSATYTAAITVYQGSSNNVVQRNDVHDCTGNGIFVGGSSTGAAFLSTNNVVINNFVRDCPGIGVYPGGVSLRYAVGAVVSNNSVWMPAGSANDGIYIAGATTSMPPAEISNNIVKHDGTGGCIGFQSSGLMVPTILDWNLYDVAPGAAVGVVLTTTYPTLVAWQAVTTPNLTMSEMNSVEGSADFVSATDMHILASSAGFRTGNPVAQVIDDIDGDLRLVPPSRGADELSGAGLFAAFQAVPTSGPAPLLVSFADASITNDPAGVQTWAWDFENDGIDDAFIQTPVFTYNCPGTYSVRLTVTDTINGTASVTRQNLITVGDYTFSMSSSGAGDLSVTPVPANCYPTVTRGWTFVSFNAVAGMVGGGIWFGINPDAATFLALSSNAAPGNALHFIPTPTTYPNVPLVLPAGTVNAPGLRMDAVQVMVDATGLLVYASNVAQVVF